MVIFCLFVNFFFVLFVSRRSSWFLFVFSAHSRPNGYFWSGYFRRSVAWVFSPASLDLEDELDEDPARISPDTPALSLDLTGSRRIHRPFLRIPYTILERKKNEEEKNKSISVLFFFYFFFKNTDFGDVG
jgi:hypothetical protein